MANDVNKVSLAVDGGIWIGPEGGVVGKIPDSSAFAPGTEGYDAVGYYSQEGSQLTPVPGTETSITAHNGDVVFDQAEPGWWTFAFGAIEFRNSISAEMFFDTPIDDTDGSIEVTTAAVTTYRSLISIAINSDATKSLAFFPRVKISERQTINFNNTSLVALGATFKTFKDNTLGYHFKMFEPTWKSGL